MDSVFEKAGRMDFYCPATGGGLTDEFGLDFGPDVNGNSHANATSFAP
jgi:hypothetical protein